MFLGHLLAHALGHTRGGQFFNGLMLLFFVTALPIGSVAGFAAFGWNEYAKESNYQRRFGANWRPKFEAEEGSLIRARVKVSAALVGAVLNTILGVLLYRHLIPALRGVSYATRPPRSRRRARARERPKSHS